MDENTFFKFVLLTMNLFLDSWKEKYNEQELKTIRGLILDNLDEILDESDI